MSFMHKSDNIANKVMLTTLNKKCIYYYYYYYYYQSINQSINLLRAIHHTKGKIISKSLSSVARRLLKLSSL